MYISILEIKAFQVCKIKICKYTITSVFRVYFPNIFFMPDLLYYSYMPMQTHEIFLHNCNYILHELFKKYISSMVKSYIKTTALSTKVHVEGSEIIHIKN